MQWKIKPFEELSASELYDILWQRCSIFVVEQSCPYPDIDGADRLAWQLFGCDEEGRSPPRCAFSSPASPTTLSHSGA